MTCACGTFICYLCRRDISKEKYQHFCQTPHCDHKTCQKCLLYTNTVEDDRRAMLEAGLKVLNNEEEKEGLEEERKKAQSAANTITTIATAGGNGLKLDEQKKVSLISSAI